MEPNCKNITVFVSYTIEAKEFRDKVFDACTKYNIDHSKKTKYTFLPVDWEKCAIREAGPRAQSIINEHIMKSDVFIGILWKRFGTKTGAISMHTGLEYESGMQEEFEIALDKKKSDDNFKLIFFFKNIENVNVNFSQEAEQIAKVLEFKEELKSKKIFIYEVNNQNEIGLETYRYLQKKVDEFVNGVKEIKKIKSAYPIEQSVTIENYLSRTVLQYKDAISGESSYLRYIASKDITEVLDKEKRIVLLADAGSGKTTELQRIISIYSDEDSEYYPIFVRLNLYTDEKIEDLLPDYWEKIPEKSLLLLLDGFDEIKSDYKINAVREIEKFSEKYLSCKVIITCRTNFYNSANNTFSGTLKSFTVFVLNQLSPDEISKYITKELDKKANLFYEATRMNKSHALLDIPFYLKFLVNEYQRNNELPSSRNEIYETLIYNSIQHDEEHFRTTNNEDIIENREVALANFEKLALIMETLCRNNINTKEYFLIIPNKRIRQILKQTGLWNKRGDRWQFEHNSFQEYLAARTLSNVSLHEIKKFLAFPTRFSVIIPSWINTLSFLLNNYKNNALKNWILRVQPELTIKFEPDRVNESLRMKIFSNIFNNYKRKKIWIDRDKYDFYELAKFGESQEAINFLLRNINVKAYYTVVGNAINLLAHMELPFEYMDKVRMALINTALLYDNNYIRNDAMIAIGVQRLNDKDTIEKLFSVFEKSENDWIRYGMYYLIEQSAFLDEYIDYFLDGIRFYSDRFSSNGKGGRIGNEFWHLEAGLKKVNLAESALKILDHLLTNPSIVHIIGFDSLIPEIMVNFSTIYLRTKEERIFEKICDLYLILSKQYYLNEAAYCLVFFDKSNTRTKAFQLIYNQKNGNDLHDLFSCLAHLSNQDCTEIITKEFSKGNISEQEIWYYQFNLNGELSTSFNEKINAISNNRFILKPARDFTKEREIKLNKDIEFLFNKEAFISEILLLFETEKVKILTKDLLDDIRYKRYDICNTYSSIMLRELGYILENGEKSFKEIKEIVEKIDWENYSAIEIFNYIENSIDIVIDADKLNSLAVWCKAKLEEVDFKNALTQTGTTFTANNYAIMLHQFLRKYKFTYRKDKLLDMISFDWHGVGIDYLEEFLTIEEMTKTILANLKSKDSNDYELRNYFRFCFKHKIMTSKESAKKEIINIDRDVDIRKLALELLVELQTDNKTILSLLKKIDDSFKWELVELLVNKNNQKVRNYLLQVIKDSSNSDQIIVANYLMRMQDLAGLKFYTEFLEKEKKFVHAWYQKSTLSHIKNPEALKYLFRLLYLSYDKDLKQDKFDTLYRVVENVLTNIALMNESNFKKVYKLVIIFIKKNNKKYKEVNFLYSYLDRLERQYYVTKSQKVSLKEALWKANSIIMAEQ